MSTFITLFCLFFRLFRSSRVHCYPASPGEDNLWLLADGLGARVAFDCQPLLYWQSGMSPFLASNHRRNAFLGNQQKRRPNEADPSWRSRHFGQKGHQAQSWVGKPPLLLLPLDTKMRFLKDLVPARGNSLTIFHGLKKNRFKAGITSKKFVPFRIASYSW